MIFLSRLLPVHRRGTALVPLGAALACCPQSRAGSSQARSRRLRVLVDMDGVIADFEGGFLKKYRARYPDELYIPLEDRKGFWVSKQYGKLRPELCEKAISIWEAKKFFLDLDPIPGAVEAVKHMASLEGYVAMAERRILLCSAPTTPAKMVNTDVFICTSPIQKFKYCPYEKFAWVEKHLGHEFLEQIVLTRDKTVVSADLLIDDRLDITGSEPTPSWEHILFTACHNQHYRLPPPCRRLLSWKCDWKAILDSKRL